MTPLITGASAFADEAVRCIRPEPQHGQSQAVVVRALPLLHTCQILPVDGKGRLQAAGDAQAQVKTVFAHLRRLLDTESVSPRQVVKLNLYVRDAETNELARKECANFFRGPVRPAVSVVATPLPVPGALVALDAVATDPTRSMAEVAKLGRAADFGGVGETVAAATLPAGPRVYIAGQAEKGDGSLADATRQTMSSLMKTLTFLGLEPRHVIQLKAFLTPMSNASAVHQEVAAMKAFLGTGVPPLVCVEWKSNLPIEIELVAAAPGAESSTAKDSVQYLTPPGMTASPVYARVARAQHPTSIYVAGVFAEQPAQDPEAEVRAIFRQLGTVLRDSGSDFQHLVKATYYVADDDASNLLNKLRPEYYHPERPPSASKAAVAGLGIPERRLTLDMIAVPKP